MIKERPRIRFDGVYVLKIHYVRQGENHESEHRPVHDVISFKYIRFYPDGTLVQVYSPQTPAKFIPKFIAKNAQMADLISDGMALQQCRFVVHNEKVVILQDTPYDSDFDNNRYEGSIHRYTGAKSEHTSDYISITLQGQKMSESRFREVYKYSPWDPSPPFFNGNTPFSINYAWIRHFKFNNRLPNHFVF